MQWITDQWPWFIAAAVFFLFVVSIAYSFYQQSPDDEIQIQDDGWTPTGRIDFAGDQSIGGFILQVEETQVVESIGGIEHRQIRWRKANLVETKGVIADYCAQERRITW
jgi:hypothetical protein